MDPWRELDVEALARVEARAGLSLLQLVRLYLDPLALFKNVNVGPPHAQAEAARYNRRHRGILLRYAKRWSAIALACFFCATPLAGAAGADPVLCIPFVGAELGFALGVCAAAISIAVYFGLGPQRPDEAA